MACKARNMGPLRTCPFCGVRYRSGMSATGVPGRTAHYRRCVALSVMQKEATARAAAAHPAWTCADLACTRCASATG